MSLKDFVNIDDENSIHGFVIIKDNKTGNILVKDHNMILKDGKDCLLAHFMLSEKNMFRNSNIEDVDISDTNLNDLTDYFLYGFLFSSNSSEVFFKEEFNRSASDEIIDGIKIKELNKDNFRIENDENREHLILKLSINIILDDIRGEQTTTSLELNSLYLLLKNGSKDNNYKAFSRIRFDPIILTEESSLNLTYYVYF